MQFVKAQYCLSLPIACIVGIRKTTLRKTGEFSAVPLCQKEGKKTTAIIWVNSCREFCNSQARCANIVNNYSVLLIPDFNSRCSHGAGGFWVTFSLTSRVQSRSTINCCLSGLRKVCFLLQDHVTSWRSLWPFATTKSTGLSPYIMSTRRIPWKGLFTERIQRGPTRENYCSSMAVLWCK